MTDSNAHTGQLTPNGPSWEQLELFPERQALATVLPLRFKGIVALHDPVISRLISPSDTGLHPSAPTAQLSAEPSHA